MHYIFKCTEITVDFGQSKYTIDEDVGQLQPVLILSNPSSANIIMQVTSFDLNATGEH